MPKSAYLIIGIIIGVLVMGFAFQWPAVTQGWPILIFLLCPLMHLFMGHDHGGGGHGEHHQVTEEGKKDGESCH